jgi:hypothetical protein
VVTDLTVPEVVDDPFREHYRELVLGSVLRAAEAQSELHRVRGHRLRARRAERVVERLRLAPAVPPPLRAPAPTAEPEPAPTVEAAPEPVSIVAAPEPIHPTAVAAVPPVRVEVEYDRRFGSRLRFAARLVWIVTLVLLICDIATFGIDSWTTSAADLGLIAMTFVWFFVCVDDLIAPDGPRVQQIELFR